MTRLARLALPALALVAALGSPGVSAQQVYRIVGPDGRVTFSDRPPPDGKATPAGGTAAAGGGAAGGAALPFELRNVANRYPVTLYTGNDCPPCASGRSYLQARGVPFTERTVTTPEDATALRTLAGAPSLPFLTIGGQQIRGFSEVEWGSYLDAAGYPKTSQLPAAYRNPPPSPLVATQAAPRAPATEAPAAPSAAAAPAEPPPPANPAGIRF